VRSEVDQVRMIPRGQWRIQLCTDLEGPSHQLQLGSKYNVLSVLVMHTHASHHGVRCRGVQSSDCSAMSISCGCPGANIPDDSKLGIGMLRKRCVGDTHSIIVCLLCLGVPPPRSICLVPIGDLLTVFISSTVTALYHPKMLMTHHTCSPLKLLFMLASFTLVPTLLQYLLAWLIATLCLVLPTF